MNINPSNNEKTIGQTGIPKQHVDLGHLLNTACRAGRMALARAKRKDGKEVTVISLVINIIGSSSQILPVAEIFTDPSEYVPIHPENQGMSLPDFIASTIAAKPATPNTIN